MDIAHIMKRLDESRTVEQAAIKTASVKTETPNADALRSALRSALSSGTTEKTAAVQQPEDVAGTLLKMAEDLTHAEEEALMKQAQIYGAAMCDGFMNRFGQYEKAAMEVAPAPKMASAPVYSQDPDLNAIKTAAADPDFQKFASENPELVKEAFDLGYQTEWGHLVKQANNEFEQGYNDTMTEIQKIAAQVYANGAITANELIRAAQ
jgi:hypothetical protein